MFRLRQLPMYPINLGAQGLDQLALLFASLHEARLLQRRDVLIGDLCRQIRRTRTNRYADTFSARRTPHCQPAAHPVNSVRQLTLSRQLSHRPPALTTRELLIPPQPPHLSNTLTPPAPRT